MRINYNNKGDIIKLYKSPQWLYDKYKCEKLSTYQIGHICGVSPHTICYFLKKYSIKIRSIGERHHLSTGNHCSLSPKAIEWIDGELLGDGCLFPISKYSARFHYGSKYNEYINYVSNTLCDFGIRRTGKIGLRKNANFHKIYQYVSKGYIELKLIYEKWYPNGKKIVPEDLELTPLVCKQWYIGDGSLCNNEIVRSNIMLYTYCFTIDCVEYLVKQLNKLGFKSTRQPSRNMIHISTKSTLDFLKYIGDCPVECYQYKWDYNGKFKMKRQR